MTKNNDAFRYIEILTIASDGNFFAIGLKSCGHWTERNDAKKSPKRLRGMNALGAAEAGYKSHLALEHPVDAPPADPERESVALCH
jgi:hypothetical protein